MDKEDYRKFQETWEQYIEDGRIFIRLKGVLRTIKPLPDNDFDKYWDQLSKQLEKIHLHEINEHSETPKYIEEEIGEVYSADFEMIYRITEYLRKTWPDLYSEELVKKIDDYVKFYEDKYSYNMFKNDETKYN